MERWTRAVIANRKKVLAAWLVLFVLGGYGASHLGDLLTNRFSVPGSDAERGLDLLKDRFNERGDGAFTLVFQRRRCRGRPARSLRRRPSGARRARPPREAASVVKGARLGRCSQRLAARRLRPDQHAAAEPGRRQEDAGHPRRHADAARRHHLPVGLPGDQPRHPEDLQRRPDQGRVDRDPDRADRDGLHVRDAGRDRRPASPSPRSRSPRPWARSGSSPTSWTWRST